jgi:peptidoglycan/xylan/chitin deacetylase (PgdA/CDA1 family)
MLRGRDVFLNPKKTLLMLLGAVLLGSTLGAVSFAVSRLYQKNSASATHTVTQNAPQGSQVGLRTDDTTAANTTTVKENTTTESTAPTTAVSPAFVRPQEIDPAKPMVALTFDDGPSRYTARILKVLRTNNAHATFCVVGNRVQSYLEIATHTAAGGNEIIGHSWDHKNLKKLDVAGINLQLTRTNTAIGLITDKKPRFFRPPYGAVNDTVLQVAKELGLSLAMWNLDSMDWSSRDANVIYKKIMRLVRDGSIILCHDIYDTTAAAMEKVIPELVAQGYQLVTLSDLLTAKGGDIVPGTCYNAPISTDAP